MFKRKVAMVTVIALLCAVASPAATYASGLTTGGSLSILTQIGNLFKLKSGDKKSDSGQSTSGTTGSNTSGSTSNTNSTSNSNSTATSATSSDVKKKPDPKAVLAIVQDTANQLSVLQSRCKSSLMSTALQFTKAKTTHEKTVLYAQGKATFDGCVSSFTTIIAIATLKLVALGSDSSPLDPLKAAFAAFEAEGRIMLKGIVK